MHREPGRRSSHILLYVAPLAVLLVLGLLFARSFLGASPAGSDTASLASALHGSPSTSAAIRTDSATPVSAASATSAGANVKDLGVAKGTFTLKGPAKAGKGSFVVFVLDGKKRVLKTDSSEPFSVKIDTKALPNGTYEVTVLWVRSGKPSIASTSTVRINNPGKKKSTPPKKVSPPSAGANTPAAQVLSITNAERAKVGCKALKTDADLTTAAQDHSADMAKNNYFSHDSQDGRSPFDRMKDAGYSFSAAAENIAMGQLTPSAVMTAWMNSAGHKANILNCTYTQIGIGIAKDKNGAPYWTQDFGKPL
jgi:uncharacterized protein YkwD